MRMSSSMRWRNGLIPWLEWVMALLLLRNEADCLVPNMETEPVSSHLPPELNRSPLPRERFRPPGQTGRSCPPGYGDSGYVRVRAAWLVAFDASQTKPTHPSGTPALRIPS